MTKPRYEHRQPMRMADLTPAELAEIEQAGESEDRAKKEFTAATFLVICFVVCAGVFFYLLQHR